MINEKELHEAIAECNGVKNPNANTCIKLASYYTILDHLQQKEGQVSYSYAYESPTDFGQAVARVGMDRTMEVMEDLMKTLKILNPKLYNGVMREMGG